LNLQPGSYNLQILSITMGLQSYGAHLERIVRGITGNVSIGSEDITIGGPWAMQAGIYGETHQIYKSPTAFTSGVDAGIGHPLTWFSAFVRINMHTPDSAYVIDLLGTKGFVYFNGRSLGRYWLIQSPANGSGCGYCDYKVTYTRNSCFLGCGGYTQRYYHLPRDWINFDSSDNLLVVFEEIGGNPYSVNVIELGIPSPQCGVQSEIPNFAAAAYLRCVGGGTYIRQITYASFGTPPQETECGSYKTPGTCNSPNVTKIVEDACLGRSSCQIPVSISLFGDPCPGTLKYLYMQAVCA